ncbi:GNAT family N-acetyltransferase [Labrenzia sp. R4_1]|uniref:GNAT family N-acetyltransferase n=1 Tax=Labrenzia sp. R4_1 TaxID=2821106 RepID=UPI001ADAE2CD|nr:GNAT family N-acetyltransferase [Labrenzia sp. R4_1]MBO9427030.1 GNAT family N-acetyltransferase [Labrenzia sp. R4_1]
MTSTMTFTEPVSAHAEVTAEIERNLLASLSGLNSQATNSTLVLSRRDPNGNLVAGLSGSTSYGWLLVKLLWVHRGLRGTGVGTVLMGEAEERAKAIGCHGAWLDTSNQAARDFYRRLGYSDFGLLSNSPGNDPEGHCRWFMKKSL